MFNSFMKNISKNVSKVTTGSNIYTDIQKKANENKQKKDDSYEIFYKEGVRFLEDFLRSLGKDKESLKNSIINLTNANKLNRNNPDIYFYLAYISYLTEDFTLAKKYYETCKLISPNYVGLEKLSKRLLNKVGN